MHAGASAVTGCITLPTLSGPERATQPPHAALWPYCAGVAPIPAQPGIAADLPGSLRSMSTVAVVRTVVSVWVYGSHIDVNRLDIDVPVANSSPPVGVAENLVLNAFEIELNYSEVVARASGAVLRAEDPASGVDDEPGHASHGRAQVLAAKAY